MKLPHYQLLENLGAPVAPKKKHRWFSETLEEYPNRPVCGCHSSLGSG
jgi:hypothetical protein